MNEEFLWWVGEKQLTGRCLSVGQSVGQSVCPSIFGSAVRAAGPIGTGEAPFDASFRRNDDGVGRRWIGDHVICDAANKLVGPTCQTRSTIDPKLSGHTNLWLTILWFAFNGLCFAVGVSG